MENFILREGFDFTRSLLKTDLACLRGQMCVWTHCTQPIQPVFTICHPPSANGVRHDMTGWHTQIKLPCYCVFQPRHFSFVCAWKQEIACALKKSYACTSCTNQSTGLVSMSSPLPPAQKSAWHVPIYPETVEFRCCSLRDGAILTLRPNILSR